MVRMLFGVSVAHFDPKKQSNHYKLLYNLLTNAKSALHILSFFVNERVAELPCKCLKMINIGPLLTCINILTH